MKLVSWNVNGYRAVQKKNFPQWLKDGGADAVCLQETKVRPDQLDDGDLNPDGYIGIWNAHNTRKGYCGVATLLKNPPLSTAFGLPDVRYQGEGRLIVTEHDGFFLANCYFPNGQKGDDRLAFKMGFYDAFLDYAEQLRAMKPVIISGDVNTAHTEIDLARPKENEHTSGFLAEERAWIDALVAKGYVDTFRMFEKNGGHYSWWDYVTKARERNVGWRIDYFFVSSELADGVRAGWIESDVHGSDHCPVGIELRVA